MLYRHPYQKRNSSQGGLLCFLLKKGLEPREGFGVKKTQSGFSQKMRSGLSASNQYAQGESSPFLSKKVPRRWRHSAFSAWIFMCFVHILVLYYFPEEHREQGTSHLIHKSVWLTLTVRFRHNRRSYFEWAAPMSEFRFTFAYPKECYIFNEWGW